MEKYATLTIMTGPTDPTEAEGPCVLGASSGHALRAEVVVKLTEPPPPVPNEDGYARSDERGIQSTPHFGTNPSRVPSAWAVNIDTAAQRGIHSALDDAVSPRDPRDSLEPGALYTTVEERVSCFWDSVSA